MLDIRDIPIGKCDINNNMSLSQRFKEFMYSLSAKDKYSDFDSRKSFNRVNKAESSLLYHHQNASTTSVSATDTAGVHETRLAWRHIKKWLHKHSPDLNESLLSACSEADIHELQKDLGCQLPQCVTELYTMTNGQTSFNSNGSSGLVFGLRLMAIDQVAAMTESWRSVHSNLSQQPKPQPPKVENDLGMSREHLSDTVPEVPYTVPTQRSVPPHTIAEMYADPMWIPLLTDDVGNCVGVDLSGPESGEHFLWGQVILFGRDFDTKFKVADTFGDFLLLFANDLERGNWELKSSSDTEDMVSGVDADLVWVDRATGKEKPYLDVLRERALEAWVASLSPEQRQEPENAALLKHLQSFSYKVGSVREPSDKAIHNMARVDVDASYVLEDET